jgi:hypothetical protein
MLQLLRTLDRICHESHSRWINWEKLITIPAINKVRSIAEVDGLGACVVATMLLNPHIRKGVVQVTHAHELRATHKHCLVSLASAGEQVNTRYTKKGLLIRFSKRQILISSNPSPTVLGGSDAVIMQFPTPEQYEALRGGTVVVSHIIDNINLDDSNSVVMDFEGEIHRLWQKPKTASRKITWGAIATKIIGARTGRERESGMRS